MDIVHLDFETFYEVGGYSLSTLSTQQYILDDRYQTIGCSFRWPDDKVPHWHTGRDLERQLQYLKDYEKEAIVSAWNCLFDASILAFRYDTHPAELACPMSMARSLGLGLVGGLSLDAVSKTAIAAGLPIPNKGIEVQLASGKRLEHFTPAELAAYGGYCNTDVAILKALFDELVKHLPAEELLWQSTVLKMFTERPFVVDRAIVLEEQERVRARRAAALGKLCHALGVQDQALLTTVVNSNAKFAEALQLFGAEPPMKRSPATGKQTFAFSKTDPGMLALQEHEVPEVAALAEARLGLKSSIEASRCVALLEAEKLGPLPIPLQIHGAHTGRLSGGGAGSSYNVQNFSSGRKAGQSKSLKESLTTPGRVLTGGDSSQIEVRVLDYIANDQQGIANFEAGLCPYSAFAANFWPTPGVTAADVKKRAKDGDELWGTRRQLSKVTILASGYGIGAKKFMEYADTQGGIKLTFKEAKVYNTGYKTSKPRVPALWRTCDRVLQCLANGEAVEFGGPTGKLFLADPHHRVLGQSLPSILGPDGMRLHYPGIEFVDVEELVDVLDEETGEVIGRERQVRNKCRFWTKKGRSNVENWTWGGTLAENCVAGDTEVLTQAGWRRLDSITDEWVHDGVEFVAHRGRVSRGMQTTVTVDGVSMTPDHEVLTNDGWQQAGALILQERLDLWIPDCAGESIGAGFGGEREESRMEFPLRVRGHGGEAVGGCQHGGTDGAAAQLRVPEPHRARERHARYVGAPSVLGVALDARPVPPTDAPSVEELWGSRNPGVRPMGGELRELLGGHGADLREGPGPEPHRQQRGILTGELRLGGPRGELQQQANDNGDADPRGADDRIAGVSSVRGRGDNSALAAGEWVDGRRGTGTGEQERASDVPTRMPTAGEGRATVADAGRVAAVSGVEGARATGEHGAAPFGRGALPERGTARPVYDLLDCGPRHRFVVRGAAGPFVVHNCCQYLAFAVIKWQSGQVPYPHAINEHDAMYVTSSIDDAADALAQLRRAMSTTPPWVPGLPLACEVGQAGSLGDVVKR